MRRAREEEEQDERKEYTGEPAAEPWHVEEGRVMSRDHRVDDDLEGFGASVSTKLPASSNTTGDNTFFGAGAGPSPAKRTNKEDTD
ncbi:unnamed protein product, partial [Amoebophrya sp. A120]|eukprot:GSA120T00017879001.1